MPDTLKPINRRRFLRVVAGTAIVVSRGIPPTEATLETSDPLYGKVTLDRMTLSEKLFVHSKDIPSTTLDNWQLRVSGLIDGEAKVFAWDDLCRYPLIESMRTIECIGNPTGGEMIGNALWKGFRFCDFAAEWGIQPAATHAKFTCADGYQTAVTLDRLLHPDTLLVSEMNGEPLPPEHGYPLRLIVPGVYGQKMPKWITHIELIDYPFQGFWESLGWSDTAEVQTHAIILTPKDRARINGKVAIQGIAFAGSREIVQVEVRINNGEWSPAWLVKGDSNLAWTQWYLEWKPTRRGSYTLEARATDSDGFTQFVPTPRKLNHARPNGSAYIHRLILEVV